jgi:acetoin utilization protein AcuB
MFQIHGINGIQRAFIPGAIRNRREVQPVHKTNTVTEAPTTENESTEREAKPNNLVSRYQPAIIAPQTTDIVFAHQIMSSPVFTVLPTTTLHAATEIFAERRYRHIPVVATDGALLGLISDRDVLRYRANSAHHVANADKESVSKLMITEVLVATPETRIRDIARTMFEERIGSLPIVEESGTLTGIITRSDILRALIAHGPIHIWA